MTNRPSALTFSATRLVTSSPTDAFASILAESRKYHLCLTLSHQYIDQLQIPVRQAVFGNVGTLVAFRTGYADAEVLEKELSHTFSAGMLADLDRYEAAVKLLGVTGMRAGRSPSWWSAPT